MPQIQISNQWRVYIWGSSPRGRAKAIAIAVAFFIPPLSDKSFTNQQKKRFPAFFKHQESLSAI